MEPDYARLLNEINEKLDRLETMINKADKTIAIIAAEVKPTLDALMGHPMLKMFLGGKK